MRQYLWATGNQHAGFCKHFICEETLSQGDSPTYDQDISSIKYTRGANFTKLCRRHREMSTTNVTRKCSLSHATGHKEKCDENGILFNQC